MDSENASFWLPSSFLTDDDFLMEKPTAQEMKNHMSCDFFGASRVGSDPFDSPLSSTDNDENTTDDDPFLLSNLTRHLARTSLGSSHNTKNSNSERPWVISTSPQSTLSGYGGGWSGFSSNGSPNGPSRVPSPPLTPELKNDAAWDLLYEAAGQVARLKMNAIAAQMNNNRGLLGAPRHHSSVFSTPSVNQSGHLPDLYNKQYQELKWAQNCNNLGRHQESEPGLYCRHHHHDSLHLRRSCGGGTLGLPQSAWPPLSSREPHPHSHHRQPSCGSHMRGVYPGGAAKRQSTGTGVFIPRKVSTSPPRQQHLHQQAQHSDFRRKPTVAQQTRVAQPLDMQFEEANLKSHSRFPTDHAEIMMLRRNAILGQQRRTENNNNTTTMMGQPHEILLPTDWTY